MCSRFSGLSAQTNSIKTQHCVKQQRDTKKNSNDTHWNVTEWQRARHISASRCRVVQRVFNVWLFIAAPLFSMETSSKLEKSKPAPTTHWTLFTAALSISGYQQSVIHNTFVCILQKQNAIKNKMCQFKCVFAVFFGQAEVVTKSLFVCVHGDLIGTNASSGLERAK